MSSQLKSTLASTGIVRLLSVLLIVMLVASAGFSGGALAHDVSNGTDTAPSHDHGSDKSASDHDHDGKNEIDQQQNNTQRNQAIINYGIQVNANRQRQRAGGNAIGSQYQYSNQTNLAGINYGIQLNLNFQRQIAGLNASVNQTQISRQANLAGINYGLQQNVNVQEQRATITQQGDQAQNALDHDHSHDKGASEHKKHDQGNKGAPNQDASVDQTQISTQLNAAIVNYGTQENFNDQTQEASVNQYSGAVYNFSSDNEIDYDEDMVNLVRELMSDISLNQLAS